MGGKVFPDPAMTLVAVDRLVHHASIFEMNVESYRRREAIDRKRGPGRPAAYATPANIAGRAAAPRRDVDRAMLCVGARLQQVFETNILTYTNGLLSIWCIYACRVIASWPETTGPIRANGATEPRPVGQAGHWLFGSY
jgi:hypothetical protein